MKFYEKSQNMSKFLAKVEERVTEQDLLEELISAASYDPENMKVGTVLLPGEEIRKPVVLGEHTISRAGKRLGLDAGEALRMAIDALKNPLVSQEVFKHTIVLNDKEEIVSFDDDNITSTILVDKKSRYTLVFEAGFNYILLKTVWDNCFGELRTNKTNIIITIDRNGAITRKVGGAGEQAAEVLLAV